MKGFDVDNDDADMTGKIYLSNQGPAEARGLITYEFFAQFPNWRKLCRKF